MWGARALQRKTEIPTAKNKKMLSRKGTPALIKTHMGDEETSSEKALKRGIGNRAATIMKLRGGSLVQERTGREAQS